MICYPEPALGDSSREAGVLVPKKMCDGFLQAGSTWDLPELHGGERSPLGKPVHKMWTCLQTATYCTVLWPYWLL